MDFAIGVQIWVPCEVRPGPFCNERRVRIQVDDNEWFGFVGVKWLKNKVEEGPDEVLARVVNVSGETFQASIPGDAPKPSLFEGQVKRATAVPQ